MTRSSAARARCVGRRGRPARPAGAGLHRPRSHPPTRGRSSRRQVCLRSRGARPSPPLTGSAPTRGPTPPRRSWPPPARRPVDGATTTTVRTPRSPTANPPARATARRSTSSRSAVPVAMIDATVVPNRSRAPRACPGRRTRASAPRQRAAARARWRSRPPGTWPQADAGKGPDLHLPWPLGRSRIEDRNTEEALGPPNWHWQSSALGGLIEVAPCGEGNTVTGLVPAGNRRT